jgi:hypothetical protein
VTTRSMTVAMMRLHRERDEPERESKWAMATHRSNHDGAQERGSPRAKCPCASIKTGDHHAQSAPARRSRLEITTRKVPLRVDQDWRSPRAKCPCASIKTGDHHAQSAPARRSRLEITTRKVPRARNELDAPRRSTRVTMRTNRKSPKDQAVQRVPKAAETRRPRPSGTFSTEGSFSKITEWWRENLRTRVVCRAPLP